MEKLAWLVLSLTTTHPGHGTAVPWCEPAEDGELCALQAEPETNGDSAVHLCRVVLERGSPAQAARMVAPWAERSAEAARILAEALEQLGDPEGAKIARERAARLAGQGAER